MLSNKVLKSLLVTPAMLGATVLASASAIASELEVNTLEQLNQYSAEGDLNSMSQVTSVSQLSDVQPTDWAFQALQSLVERYGCIAGYPDGTYRGNRAMTRFEFAAGLNACLDRINELIAAGLADKVSREDLAVLQRLQEEFAAELATLRGRVDALEARVSELEANQFSTTTKLNGEVIFFQNATFASDDAFDNSDEATFGYRARLNFDTSFTGEDRLRTRFQARNVNAQGTDAGDVSFGGDNGGDFQLDDLVYTFPLGPAEIIVGANSIGQDDFVASTISPLDSASSGSISNFGFPPQYGMAVSGSGAGLGAVIGITDNLSIDFGYNGDQQQAGSPLDGEGIFNGDYTMIAQLTFLSDVIDAAFTYANAYTGASDYDFVLGPEVATVANTYGGQLNFKLGDTFEVGGGLSYANYQGIGANPDYEGWSWQGTIAVNDLAGDGNQLGILAGVLPYTRDLGDTDTSVLVEGYYRFQLNDNISITPSIIWIEDPDFNTNNDFSDGIIGSLRTTFKF